ncbi:acetylcholine receptor subunit beta-type unc-29-like [Mercenaria mercenaria]|uniref:acetylcholine receptor subunit beta-type unc-29-like n=1 Tax=Mercenaria mercenaria TaxID=6596 RepID=UPI00234E91F0|nr:acetylcholine receptor subunit beta-type unc-29-like [Mercenaria mercenaria]
MHRHRENINKVLYLALIVVLITPVTCHTMTDAKKLLADKQLGYEKTFRPIVNQSAPVVLNVALELVSIEEFNEVQETLTITAVVVLNWRDEYMKWNPSDYGNLEQLVFESDKVWVPNLVLINNVEKLEKVGDAWQLIRFTSDGIAFYYPGNVFSASCRVDVTYYPWDKHRCIFTFTAWGQDTSEIVFQPSTEKVQTTYFSENGAWTFYDSSVETYYGNGSMEFSLYLKRKPRFVLVNVIVPIIFMAFLNIMIFAIPVESGERISYSITVLLAIAVFLTLVGDNLPKTSSPMSFFSYYLLIVLVISICIVLATIFNVRLYYRDDEDPIPGCLSSFVRCMRCKFKNKRHNRKRNFKKNAYESNRFTTRNRETQRNESKYKRNNGVNNDSYDTSIVSRKSMYHGMSNNHNKFLSDLNSNSNTEESETNSIRFRQKDMLMDSSISWKDVSATFDRVFFVLSFIIVSTATVVFFMYIFVSKES